MNDNKTLKGLAIGLVAGAVVGGITALLLAPKSGRELRGDIRRKTADMAEDVETYLATARDKARTMINEGRDKSSALVADAKLRAESLLKDTEQMLAGAKQKISEDTARLRQAVKAGADAFAESGRKARTE